MRSISKVTIWLMLPLLLCQLTIRPAYAATARVTNVNGATVLDAIINAETNVRMEGKAGAVLLGQVIDKTVRITMGPAKLKVLGAIALQAGLMFGTAELAEWLADQVDIRLNQAGTGFEKASLGAYAPTPGTPGVGAYSGTISGKTATVDGFGTSGAGAIAACQAAKAGYSGASGCTTDAAQIVYDGNVGNWNSYYWLSARFQEANSGPYHQFPWPKNGATVTQQTVWSNATGTDLQNALNANYAAGEHGNMARASTKAMAEQLNTMRAGWPQPDVSAPSLTSQQQTDTKGAFDDAISQEDQDELEDEGQVIPDPGSGVTDVNIVGQEKVVQVEVVNQPEGFTDMEYTPEQMATGAEDVASAAYEAAGGGAGDGGGSEPPEGWEPEIPEEPEQPEQDSLTDFLDWWWTSLAALPVVSTITYFLEEETVTVTSQNPVVTLARPAWLGGGMQVDFSQGAWLFEFMGHTLYTIVGIRMLWWLMGKKED